MKIYSHRKEDAFAQAALTLNCCPACLARGVDTVYFVRHREGGGGMVFCERCVEMAPVVRELLDLDRQMRVPERVRLVGLDPTSEQGGGE